MLAGPPGTAAAVQRLAALLSIRRKEKVSGKAALRIAVDEAIDKYEGRVLK